jgi:hypothetical protein
MGVFKGHNLNKKYMYITFTEATKRIRKAERKQPAKNPQYYDTFIYRLIRDGLLTRADPDEFFIKTPADKYVSVGKISAQALVTIESVNRYIKEREKEREKRGVITKGGKPIKVIFSDGTESTFRTIIDAQQFFGISYYSVSNALSKNTPIEIPISRSKCEQIGVDPDCPELSPMTEHIKFKYDY